jgi:transcriptional regulator with XRE-family HTH domain
VDALGPRLRALRAATGRTVAAVAADAGLSMPYIANLENGRGNPTLAALDRLARALGTDLSVELRPVESGSAEPPAPVAGPGPPPALVRLARTDRFHRIATELAAPAGREPAELTAALLSLLARVGPALHRDLDEADWWRLLDALVLIALHPSRPPA